MPVPSYTGRRIAEDALRELGILDPIEPIDPEQLAQVLEIATDLLDMWRTDSLSLHSHALFEYPLVSDQAGYTIGPGGDFDQDWPEDITRWGLITEVDGDDTYEQPMGRLLAWPEYANITVKGQRGTPKQLFYNGNFSSDGVGLLAFHPAPDVDGMYVRLYQQIAEMSGLVANTTYTFRPGGMRALKLSLAVACGPRFEHPIAETDPLYRDATQARAAYRRSHIRPQQSPIRPGFAIGSRRRRGSIRNV